MRRSMETINEAAKKYSEEIFPYNPTLGPIAANKERDKQIALEKAYMSAVAWAERWISVKEELPKPGETILIRKGSFFKGMGHFDGKGYFHSIGLGNDSLIQHKITITHWRPIEHK